MILTLAPLALGVQLVQDEKLEALYI